MDQQEWIKKSLANVTAGEWNQLIGDTNAKFIGIADESRCVADDELQRQFDLLTSQGSVDAVLLFPAAFAESVAAWEKLPAPVASLRENVTERINGMVFRVSALKELGCHLVSSPIWDLVIRASTRPGSLQANQLTDDMGDAEKAAPFELPALAPAVPGSDRRWLFEHLEAFSLEDVVPNVTSRADATALKAGLLQIHDYLDESHEFSQSVQGKGRHAAGDYWHAIMHRREPDYSNAKYWFRNVGAHPIFEPLAAAVDQLLAEKETPAAETAKQKLRAGAKWDPFAFVDFCQECERSGDTELTQMAKKIQWLEMQLLLEQTYLDAVG